MNLIKNVTAKEVTIDLPPELKKKRLIDWLMLFFFAIALAWAWNGSEMFRVTSLWTDRANMAVFAKDFFPMDFSQWKEYVEGMVVTVKIALWGTILSIIAAAIFGLMSSENISPWWLVQPTRRLMDMFRAINEIVFATLFVVAVGLGPFAGVLAIFVHTTGVLAKLFSEAVESIESGPIEGVRATGASKIEEILYGVIPQVLPLWASYGFYRFESNVRSATILGIVGAGGIGLSLYESIRGFDYAKTSAIMFFIVVTVVALDYASQFLRKRFI